MQCEVVGRSVGGPEQPKEPLNFTAGMLPRRVLGDLRIAADKLALKATARAETPRAMIFRAAPADESCQHTGSGALHALFASGGAVAQTIRGLA